MRTRSTDSAWLFQTLRHSSGRNLLFIRVKEGAERVLKVTDERDNLMLRLND